MACPWTGSIVTCLLSFFLLYAGERIPVAGAETVSRVCLGCICEAASGCNVTVHCDGPVCGPFRITWDYWADAGKPLLDDKPSTPADAYPRCVNDPFCAARAVEAYMTKYAQDCNGDGVINCDDFIRIHRFGGYGCGGTLNKKYEDTYKLCMQTFDKQ